MTQMRLLATCFQHRFLCVSQSLRVQPHHTANLITILISDSSSPAWDGEKVTVLWKGGPGGDGEVGGGEVWGGEGAVEREEGIAKK